MHSYINSQQKYELQMVLTTGEKINRAIWKRNGVRVRVRIYPYLGEGLNDTKEPVMEDEGCELVVGTACAKAQG